MTIELASVEIKQKPWGSTNLLPWNGTSTDGAPVGELWFQRADTAAPDTALLLKLLFTTEPLSIQVHPDDAFARSIGLANGKTEAWYILSAGPDARIALGLKRTLSPLELRSAIADGSIVDMVQWYPARAGDVVYVPAGTIHAVGAGIVLAEVQQRSDATFRLFDYGRQRELHIDNAVVAAIAGPAKRQSSPIQFDEARKAVVVDAHFVLEQIEFLPGSVWTIEVQKEAWLLAIGGSAQIGSVKVAPGEAIFVEGDRADIQVGDRGLKALLAYIGPHVDPWALKQRSDNVGRHSSPAPLIAAVSENFLPKAPEVQT
ncbi:mannose-6-phosphate isomerase [Bradyrhizobium sp. KBS0727]|uniref:class I mannose-6-phosphate isomerase n=1 Tax=unclassified Bradyrhizobium TaxID=2631580 RepID=UPI00110EB2EA|nr:MULTISPECIES: class I mannose-6-phosphate isomerase [unclassified Bradyrhizobium]QDW38627.1 mannose-6-phosphate isomerase [Bradyrhizobium sp. KBS0725]QDW45231.1 mannose-6-phosphate isomerase [Bradyrhizobium sp. KBS0727]